MPAVHARRASRILLVALARERYETSFRFRIERVGHCVCYAGTLTAPLRSRPGTPRAVKGHGSEKEWWAVGKFQTRWFKNLFPTTLEKPLPMVAALNPLKKDRSLRSRL